MLELGEGKVSVDVFLFSMNSKLATNRRHFIDHQSQKDQSNNGQDYHRPHHLKKYSNPFLPQQPLDLPIIRTNYATQPPNSMLIINLTIVTHFSDFPVINSL